MNMQLNIHGSNIDLGASFEEAIEKRLNEIVSKYHKGDIQGVVRIEKNGTSYSADCFLKGLGIKHSGADFSAKAEGHDPKAAFSDACDRLEKQLRRFNRMIKSHGGVSDKDAEARAAERSYAESQGFMPA